MVGRLNTETGESKVVTPTPKSTLRHGGDYEGVPYFIEFSASHRRLSRNDGHSRVSLPGENARPRRLAVTTMTFSITATMGALSEPLHYQNQQNDGEWPSADAIPPYGITIVTASSVCKAGVRPNHARALIPKQKNSNLVIPAGGGVGSVT
jgi:hypothetical protein